MKRDLLQKVVHSPENETACLLKDQLVKEIINHIGKKLVRDIERFGDQSIKKRKQLFLFYY